MNKIHKEIGEELAKARKKSKLTQTQLANQLGVKQGYISRIENGIDCVSLDKLVQLSTHLDHDITVKFKKRK